MSIRNTAFITTYDDILYEIKTTFHSEDYPMKMIESMLSDLKHSDTFAEEEYYKLMEYNTKPIKEVLDNITGRDLEIISYIFNLYLSCTEDSDLFDIAYSINESLDSLKDCYIITEDNEDSIVFEENKVTFNTNEGREIINFGYHYKI